jgi:regulator of replication initiation timing
MENISNLFVSVKDACECYKKEISVKRAHSNFNRIIESFQLKPEDNIIPFLYMIITDPISFKDPNKYPSTWKEESSKANGISAVNQCINISIIKNSIGQQEVNKIRNALGTYITELQDAHKKKKEDHEHLDDSKSESSLSEAQIATFGNSQTSNTHGETFTDREHLLLVIEQKQEEIRILKFKNEKLFKMLSVFANGNQTEINKEWVALTAELFNMVN